jgi:hypothetical protein
MRRTKKLDGLTFLALVTVTGGALAEDGAARPLAPLEMLSCRFNEGKGPADLRGLADGFNAWMEKYDAPAYAAYTISPTSHSDEIEFDLAWLGSWPDPATMGASMEHYYAHGAELGPVFNSVMSCSTNTNYAVATILAPAQPGVFGPLEVTSCSIAEGASRADVEGAITAWSEYAQQERSGAAEWLLYPAYGERSDAHYDFKWATGYASYRAWGEDYDQLRNGGGHARYAELFAALLTCDSPRLYSVTPIRPAR